jgi:hypothetical protein
MPTVSIYVKNVAKVSLKVQVFDAIGKEFESEKLDPEKVAGPISIQADPANGDYPIRWLTHAKDYPDLEGNQFVENNQTVEVTAGSVKATKDKPGSGMRAA